ncbi:MAG: hypothetical protein K2X47_11830, partial [Bdellovibrionales bacterium]|nr:hypothetical protein [Bdellovibrionales bacterium]
MAKRYCLRKPSGRSKSYSIYKQIDLDDGTTKNETLNLKEVDSINQNFESKIIDAPTAEKNLKKIMRKLYADDGRHLPKEVNNTDNYRVLDEYWKREYESRDLIDRDTAYSALRRAIDALGDIPILSAPVQDIQKQIDSQFSGNKQ